jgi:hypothetical protein
MPSIDNPNGLAASLPGQIAGIRRDIKDLSNSVKAAPVKLVVGSGGLTVAGQITSIGSRATLSGTTNALYVDASGNFGLVPSTERVKQDITPFNISEAAVNALQLVHFKYIQDVETDGEDAPIQIGLIAEEVEKHLGSDFVFYDDEGRVAGIHIDRLVFALLPALQAQSARVTALEERLTKAGL